MDPISWLIIGICIFLHFFFSASESALASANRFKFQIKADDGSKASKLVLKVCDNYDRALCIVLIGANIVAILASSVSTIAFLNLFSSLGLDDSLISLISSIVITLLMYIFGDALAKTIAKAIPDTLSFLFIYPIYFLMLVFYPLTIVFERLASLTEKVANVEEEEDFNEEDFENVVEKVSDEGVIEEEQGEIIQSALEFADTNVKEVLTPKDKMFALDIETLDKEKLNKILIETNFSRIPIYKGNINNIIGILYAKTYFKEYMHNPDIKISKTLQKPYFVSTKIMIDDLFMGFKKRKTHIAIVRDFSFNVVGMVTMDDILEEIVSDISETNNKEAK